MTPMSKIEFRRRMSGLTLRDLAHRAGLSLPTVHNAERGKCQPTIATQEAISVALGVSSDDLFPRRGHADE